MIITVIAIHKNNLQEEYRNVTLLSLRRELVEDIVYIEGETKSLGTWSMSFNKIPLEQLNTISVFVE